MPNILRQIEKLEEKQYENRDYFSKLMKSFSLPNRKGKIPRYFIYNKNLSKIQSNQKKNMLCIH